MPHSPSDFYLTHLVDLHQRLCDSPVARAYLTGTGIRLDGTELSPTDSYDLPMGRFSITEFAHLFSVFDGSRVHQQVEHAFGPDEAPPGLYFTIANPHLIQHPAKNRLGLYADPDGSTDLFIDGLHVDRYVLSERNTPPSLGTVAFALCAITAHLAGLSHVTLVAAGGNGFDQRYIGYKVWPKLGFDAPLWPDEVAQAPHLAHCQSVQDILATDAAWWDKYGSQRLMTFDLTANSTSWRNLLPYVNRKLSEGRLP
ncbi:hypothetical protein [Diaphorobacter caeni]|uniref:hypothetical protein n=1 Tax=Diaphorobacter caeni TaxID=2784387 RepID=UPI00188FCF80|nr:hypothetical protein [Diaphorobacter caeni]MBF5007156.1 hypothetical protein [Diaphorobacter caeni]